jgi:hypothetical protein
MLPLTVACSGTAKIRDIGCPVPGFLEPVKHAALKAGDDLRRSLLARSAELDTANGRIIRARKYIETICAAAVESAK